MSKRGKMNYSNAFGPPTNKPSLTVMSSGPAYKMVEGTIVVRQDRLVPSPAQLEFLIPVSREGPSWAFSPSPALLNDGHFERLIRDKRNELTAGVTSKTRTTPTTFDKFGYMYDVLGNLEV